MGGHQVPSHGSGDDGFDEEGYDESQRAEILEATRNGPTDGVVQTDLAPDTDASFDDDDAEDENIDTRDMLDTERGAVDSSVTMDEDDMDEDDVQDELDDDGIEDREGADETLDDTDDVALRP
jgi:DNA-directed RNA polymerase subunit delta